MFVLNELKQNEKVQSKQDCHNFLCSPQRRNVFLLVLFTNIFHIVSGACYRAKLIKSRSVESSATPINFPSTWATSSSWAKVALKKEREKELEQIKTRLKLQLLSPPCVRREATVLWFNKRTSLYMSEA